MDIIAVVGARPNLIKIAPLMREMRKHRQITTFLLHTGQHYDPNLSEIFFRQMGIREPDINLQVCAGSQGVQCAEMLRGIEPILENKRPDLVLVVGDVTSTLAASLAAAKLCIPVAHVEAGLRSFDRTMPEEINRMVTDCLSEYLFATEPAAVQNLLREGRPRERIYFVGNVMIDSLRQFLPSAKKSQILHHLNLVSDTRVRPFAILTLHRPSNVDSLEVLEQILSAIQQIASELTVIFPVHPRTQKNLNRIEAKIRSQLLLVPPMGYLDFMCLLSNARLVLTDSGGIQEESTVLGVPCLTLRENTERPITVEAGTNHVVGLDPAKIVAAAQEALNAQSMNGNLPPLWDGHASERIVEILLQEMPEKPTRVSNLTRR